MSGSRSGNGQAGELTPGEAFSVLANDTRVAIIETLWDADEPVSYSELKSAIGVDDSGRFNYHLEKLLGHFVERSETGYRLRVTGERAVQAIDADMFTGVSSFWPAEIGVELEELDDATIWTPTRHDPTANIRRATELVRDGSDVQFLTAVILTSALEAVQERTVSGEQTALGVVTADLFEMIRSVPEMAATTGTAIGSGNASLYRYDGAIPYCLALMDDRLAIIVQSDDEGNVRGHVETEDEAVVSWVAATIEEYRQRAEKLPADAFTT